MRDIIIVYGIGKDYIRQKCYIESEFDILAYSDKNAGADRSFENLISPEHIKDYDYDKIYITSRKYYMEIQDILINRFGISGTRIISENDMWWGIEEKRNSKVRDKWVIDKLKTIPEDSTLLDAGAGNMKYKKFCEHLRYMSQDFGEYDVNSDNEGLQSAEKWESGKCDLICDISNIPIDDGSVDAVLCTEVLEHVKDPVIVIKELSRIIRPGGRLLLTAPFCSLTHMAPFYYTNGFSRFWYQEHLSHNKMMIKEFKPYGNWFLYLAQELERASFIASRYGNGLSESEMKSIITCEKIMLNQCENDTGSEEVLCFGCMIETEKLIA